MDQSYDELETLDQDVDDIVSDLYADDERGRRRRGQRRVPVRGHLPNCGKVSTVDEETLLDQTQEPVANTAMPLLTLGWKAPRTSSPEVNDQ